MFLAIKELKYTKGKFALIISVVLLVSYLVYFLTSLAYGLASSYTNGINKISANMIILDENANDNVMMSMLTDIDYQNVSSANKAKLGVFPAVILNKDASDLSASKENVYFFGIDDLDFFLPNEGHHINQGEVIVDSSLKQLGYELETQITMPGYEHVTLTIKGFTTKATYQTAPIIYLSLEDYRTYRFGKDTNSEIYNAILVKDKLNLTDDKLKAYTINDFIQTLPGYVAQVLTFSMMIVFLIIIAAFVLGIFIYVLTIQKSSMFGVMKAQGISTAYIIGSVLTQTVLIVVIGIILGFALTQITGFFLSGIVPFALNYLFYSIIFVAFVLCALLGGLFSARAITKIDALKAIG